MKQAEQREAILCFSRHPEAGVLLMDVAGAVGLDLSFVTHVFLMEPLADKSMEEQVKNCFTCMRQYLEPHIPTVRLSLLIRSICLPSDIGQL